VAERDAVTAWLTRPSHRWWERRWFIAAIVVATMLPLLYPPLPPLVDLPGHVGRYRVELDLDRSLFLQRYYSFRWAPMGNLGVDLLVVPFAKLFGLELGVKLIVLAIPPLTAAGFLWVAREVHGRIPPTAFMALPFIYSLPFLFGFLNFALSVALAFVSFAFWLNLGTSRRTVLRRWLFVPISFALFFCHVYGLGLLGLMCFAADAVKLHESGRSWWRASLEAALGVWMLALPLVGMAFWPIASHGGIAFGWFDWDAKITGLYGVVRDRWGPLDVATLEVAAVVLLFALFSPKLGFSRKLAVIAILLATSFVLLPRYILDSAYADVRLLPYVFAVALLAIRIRQPADLRFENCIGVLACAFFLGRLATNTASLAMAADDQRAKLVALDMMPRGARVASFYALPSAEPWALQRNSHLGGLVIARREGFSNDQWLTTSHNLLGLEYHEAGTFSGNPSQLVRPTGDHSGFYRTIDEALTEVPRDKFDYIWLLNVPSLDRRLIAGLQPVWRDRDSILYRIPSQAGRH